MALNEGLTHHRAGRFNEAETAYRDVLRDRPDHAEALHLLGLLAVDLGKPETAVGLVERAIGLAPGSAAYHATLGRAHGEAGRHRQAATSLKEALRLAPDDPVLHFHMATAQRKAGDFGAAVKSFKTALSLKPDLEAALVNLGNTLQDMGDFAGAKASYKRALEIVPGQSRIHYNLGVVAEARTRLDDAARHYQQALELQRDFPEAHCNLGNVLKNQGLIGEAVAAFRNALKLRRAYPNAHSNLLLTLQNDPRETGRSLLAEARAWQENNAPQTAMPRGDFANGADADRRIRVGYVSGDFREHPVGIYVQALLAAHDPNAVETYCYANHGTEDYMTAALRGGADHWRAIVGLSDDEAMALIREDGIDILVDLSGHTAHNRLPLFSRRAAPVQITYLGYPGSTGLAAMDYRISDAIADPADADGHGCEGLLRLPRCFLCYTPPANAPDVTSLPALDRGYVTFASFNNLAKVSPGAVAAWAEILGAVPDSRLVLKNQSMADPATRREVLARFTGEGVPRERLDLMPPTKTVGEHLGLYGKIDIALDSFPYNGTTTTSEALWMGVPVIGFPGARHAGRVGASLLTHAGLEDLLAHDIPGYIEKAVTLAADLGRLKGLREELRGRLARSGIMDARAFVSGLESLYRRAWRQFVAARQKDQAT